MSRWFITNLEELSGYIEEVGTLRRVYYVLPLIEAFINLLNKIIYWTPTGRQELGIQKSKTQAI